MAILRSERWSAVLLILAAALGLVLANTAFGPAIISFTHLRLGFLSLTHWVTDGLLAVFFLLAAIELKHELTGGELSSPRSAVIPTAAAVGGVIAIARRGGDAPPIGDLVVVASLGGIGFTVSLLMNQLAWKSNSELVNEGTLAVILASVVAAVVGIGVTFVRSRRYS